RHDLPPLGAAPPRLSPAPRARRLDPLGLLPRHPLPPRRRRRDPPAGGGRAAGRVGAALAADADAARGGTAPPLARAARRDRPGTERGEDAARRPRGVA